MLELYDFQREAIKGLPKNVVLAFATGTGKTACALMHYKKHNSGLPLLVLAPASVVRAENWQNEIAAWLGEIDVTIMSYEKATRRRKDHTMWWQDYIAETPEFVLICDESHRIANSQSLMGKGAYALSQAATQFILLSATPLPLGYVSMANYGKMWGCWANITEFRRKHILIDRSRGWPRIIGYVGEDKLKDFWRSIAKPLSKDEALDLPPVTNIPVLFDTPSLYRTVKATRVCDEELLDTPSKLFHTLSQIVGTDSQRLAWLDDFIEGTDSNTIVFYKYVAEREAILNMLSKKHKHRKVYRIDGQQHDTLPQKHEWDSQHRTISLAQYQSGATGLELTYANCTIFYSPTTSYALHEQAIGRTERNGQKQKMSNYYLSAKGTVDVTLWKHIRERREFNVNLWYNEEQSYAKESI